MKYEEVRAIDLVRQRGVFVHCHNRESYTNSSLKPERAEFKIVIDI